MNNILKELGFSKEDKVLIVHADDVGLNKASIDAFLELTDFGTVSCGSAMVPCSWFPEVVKQYKEKPSLDLGLHLAFNNEYETYRWRPVSTLSPESGFTDEHGYFKHNAQEVMMTGNPEAVAKEIEAQIKLSIDLGMQPTHVDPHAGTLMAPQFIDSYINIAVKYDIIPVIMNFDMSADSATEMMMQDMLKDKQHLPEEEKERIKQGALYMMTNLKDKAEKLQEQGFPVMDNMSGLPVHALFDRQQRLEAAKHIMKTLQPGVLTHFAFHPMKDSSEARGLNRFCEGRIGDYEVFMRKELKELMKNEGIHLIGYKDIQQLKK